MIPFSGPYSILFKKLILFLENNEQNWFNIWKKII